MARGNAPESDQPARATRGFARRVAVAVVIVACLFASLVLTVFGAGTPAPAAVVVLALLAAAWRRGMCRWAGLAIAAASLSIVGLRAGRTPRGDRDWMEDVSVMPSVWIEGDLVTIRGVRNFRWLDGERFEPAWETREYHLSNLRGLDVIVEPLGACDLMAHTMLSFDFGDDGRVLLSIEARQEVGEAYGAIAGGLNRFELIYIFADERDALGQRALSGYELYAYPAAVGPLKVRAFFLGLCAAAENLRARPRFYRIVRDNCTTAWLAHSDMLDPSLVGLTLDTVLTGRIGRLMHERGVMATDLEYEAAKERFRIDERVRQRLDDQEFSARVRAGQ